MGERRTKANPVTPLAKFITDRLTELNIKQVDFCRQTGFDQGLLSKLQTSVITTVNLESALRLADGLKVAPREILELLGKEDADDLLQRLYSNQVCESCQSEVPISDSVVQVTDAAREAMILGRDLSPVLSLLRHLSSTRRRRDIPEDASQITEERALRNGA
jgi:transcriptional regulator with XRE-family HTH domain